MIAPPLLPWQQQNLIAHFEYANQLGREGKLPADYGRTKPEQREGSE